MSRIYGLYGHTGTGKTTQIGEMAKYYRKRYGKNTLLVTSDKGGYASLEPYVDLGVIRVEAMGPDDDPWTWIDKKVSGSFLTDDIGLMACDSATSDSEAVLLNCAHLSGQNVQVGSQKVLRFQIPSTKQYIGANTESHYMVTQSFMKDMIWKSTYLPVDVVWTFGEHRAESQTDAQIVGPQLAGKALTAIAPKWFTYMLRLETIPVEGDAPRHVMHLQNKSEWGGTGMSFGNSRYPLDATTTLPATIEPASMITFLELIDQGKEEAKAALAAELGL